MTSQSPTAACGKKTTQVVSNDMSVLLFGRSNSQELDWSLFKRAREHDIGHVFRSLDSIKVKATPARASRPGSLSETMHRLQLDSPISDADADGRDVPIKQAN